MKIGLVGVGAWGGQLGQAFKDAGATVAFYDRKDGDVENIDFGAWKPWREMIAERAVDAIVFAAPPDVTSEGALVAAAAGIPVLATKPLMVDEIMNVTASFYVDYWRLWHPCWLALKSCMAGNLGYSSRIEIWMQGKGPVRSFRGLHDYGPHAFAFLRDLFGVLASTEISGVHFTPGHGKELFDVTMKHGGADVVLHLGNGAEVGTRKIVVEAPGTILVYDEDMYAICFSKNGEVRLQTSKIGLLSGMVNAFLWSVGAKHSSRRFVEMSVFGNHLMREIVDVVAFP